MISINIPKEGERIIAFSPVELTEQTSSSRGSKTYKFQITRGQKLTVVGSLRVIQPKGYLTVRVEDKDRATTFKDNQKRVFLDIPVDLISQAFGVYQEGDTLENLPQQQSINFNYSRFESIEG